MKTVLAMSAALLVTTAVCAGETDLGVSDVKVLHGWKMANGNRMAAIEFTLEHGWKTYWRAPGSTGIPPRFRWTGSTNVETIAIHWPVPDVSNLLGETSLTYSDRLVLPIEIKPRDVGSAIELTGQLDFGVCKDVCLPLRTTVSASIEPANKASVQSIRTSLAKRARKNTASGMKAKCDLKLRNNGLLISAFLDGLKHTVQHVAFEYPERNTFFAGGALEQNGAQARAQVWALNSQDGPITFARDKLRMTVFANGSAVEIQGCSAN